MEPLAGLNRDSYVLFVCRQLWEELPRVLGNGFLFSLCCAPAFILFSLGFLAPTLLISVITIAPAWAALLAVQLNLVSDGALPAVSFGDAFRRYWRRSTLLGLLAAFPVLAALITLPLLQQPTVPLVVWLGLGADLLGLALLAARKWDLDEARASAGPDAFSAAAAAAEVAKLDGADTPRSQVALAAVLLAEARAGERGMVITPSVPHRMPAKEAALLRNASQRLVEAANDRPTWQPIAALAGEIALVRNDFSAAIEQFKQARAFGPDNAPLTRDLVATLTKAGRFAEANFLQATVAPAELGGAVRTSIEAEMRAGDLEAAAERTLRAVDVEHADAETLLWLGRLCARAGRREEAGSLFLRATETAPRNPDTWLWLARWEVAGGSREAGQGAIARGIEMVPEGARKLLAARGAVTVGRLDDAERDFLAAVAGSGDDLAPAGHTVDFYLQQGKPKQAEAFLEKLIGSVAGNGSRNNLESWAVRRLDGLRAAAKLPPGR